MPAPQSYNPTAEQPYQAYEPPQPLPVAPSPVAGPGQQPYQFTGAPTTHMGAVAGVLDNLFRGYMKGKESAEIKKVSDIATKTKNLQSSYNQDAERLYQMAQAGVSPDSDEYKQALSAVQGSWGALNDWVGQHVNGEDSGKKKSKSKTAQNQQGNLMEDLKSTDPNVKARALYQLQQKVGPPVLWQVKQLQTPEAQAARKAAGQAAQNQVGTQDIQAQRIQAEKDRNAILSVPEDQRTEAQKTKLATAEQILSPIATKGIDEFNQERAAIARKISEDPNYVLTDSEKAVLAGGRPTYPKAASGTAPKPGTFGDFLIKSYGNDYSAEDYVEARHKWALAGHVAGAGRGGGAGADKNYAKWDAYYKEHYPELSWDERDAMVRRKVEGATQEQAGTIAHDAIREPQQFDNDVISAAISNLRNLPQYKDMTTLDDALANIVGLGDSGYQYHTREQLGKPDKNGKYSGDVTADQLKALERDLQTQIRVVLSGSKQTSLSPQARRTVMTRLQPLFGPAARPPGSGTSPASPQAHAAAPAAPASSPAPAGVLPPEAIKHLKAGFITKFGNGQEWTLDEHGKPKQVK